MSAEWLSALAIVVLVAVFLWRGGASAGFTALVVAMVVAAILGTALFWELILTSDS